MENNERLRRYEYSDVVAEANRILKRERARSKGDFDVPDVHDPGSAVLVIALSDLGKYGDDLDWRTYRDDWIMKYGGSAIPGEEYDLPFGIIANDTGAIQLNNEIGLDMETFYEMMADMFLSPPKITANKPDKISPAMHENLKYACMKISSTQRTWSRRDLIKAFEDLHGEFVSDDTVGRWLKAMLESEQSRLFARGERRGRVYSMKPFERDGLTDN